MRRCWISSYFGLTTRWDPTAYMAQQYDRPPGQSQRIPRFEISFRDTILFRIHLSRDTPFRISLLLDSISTQATLCKLPFSETQDASLLLSNIISHQSSRDQVIRLYTSIAFFNIHSSVPEYINLVEMINLRSNPFTVFPCDRWFRKVFSFEIRSSEWFRTQIRSFYRQFLHKWLLRENSIRCVWDLALFVKM